MGCCVYLTSILRVICSTTFLSLPANALLIFPMGYMKDDTKLSPYVQKRHQLQKRENLYLGTLGGGILRS